MTAKRYDRSLLASLQEQVVYYEQQNEELAAHVKDTYESFLTFIDGKSTKLADSPSYESLQQVYGLATARMEALLTVLDQEREDITFWHKELGKVEKNNDDEHWQEVAAELIEGGDYRANAQEFKTWISAQVAELKQELTELLDDWRNCVDDGQITELAYLLEALADDQEDDDEEGPIDPFGELADDQDESDSADNERRGCSSEKSDDGCCGRQTPCCRTTK